MYAIRSYYDIVDVIRPLDMVTVPAVLPGDTVQLLGIGRVLAPDDDHDIGLFRQRTHRILIFESRIADRVEDPYLFITRYQVVDDLEKLFDLARRLRHDSYNFV